MNLFKDTRVEKMSSRHHTLIELVNGRKVLLYLGLVPLMACTGTAGPVDLVDDDLFGGLFNTQVIGARLEELLSQVVLELESGSTATGVLRALSRSNPGIRHEGGLRARLEDLAIVIHGSVGLSSTLQRIFEDLYRLSLDWFVDSSWNSGLDSYLVPELLGAQLSQILALIVQRLLFNFDLLDLLLNNFLLF